MTGTVSAINEQLKAKYQAVVTEFLSDSTIEERYVGPFVLSCPKGYAELAVPWMYVGQETFGWKRLVVANDVEAMMQEHQGFNLAQHYSGAGSPFWSFAHALDRKLNPNGPERSFLWSNLARIGKAEEAGRVPEEPLKFWSRQRLLAAEINLLRPKMVLFATGPDYDDLLTKEFPAIKLKNLSHEEPVSAISHPDLPILSFRTFHPTTLRTKKLEDSVRAYIAQKLL
jgi:hypothetical protein